MYLDFFSLKKFPFRITPDPSMFFPGGSDGPGVVLNALVYAVTSGEGIVKVVGEVGSGKTMLCRMLEERLPDSVEIVYLANPSLSARDIIYAIAFELNLDVDSSTERLLVMHKLQDYLVKKHAEGGSVVVFIEEAQGMPIETLEEIRLLSNLETHRHKLMQIILFGQPELDKNLQGKSIRQLRERITHSFYLEPMSLEQISDYLHYRLQAAGCPWPKVFTPKAEKLLSKASAGLTRRANILADKSLMAAYASSSIQPGHQYGAVQQKILPAHVKAAIRDSGYGKRFLVPWTAVFSGIGALCLALVLYLGYSNYQAGQLAMPINGLPPEGISSDSENPDTVVNSIALNPAGDITELPGTTQAPASSDVSLAEPAEVPASFDAEPELTLPDESMPDTFAETDNLPTQPAPETSAVTRSQEEVFALNDTVQAGSEPDIQQGILTPDPEVSAFSRLQGLTGIRARASTDWLKNIAGKNSYTVQMASFPVADQLMLEEFLQLLSLASMLDETYLCLISETSRRPAQWLVIHGDFSGVTRAREYINSLPAYSRQYEPYVRNSSGIACVTEPAAGVFRAR